MPETISSVGDFIKKSFELHLNKEGVENEIFHRGVNKIFEDEKLHRPSIYYKEALVENEDKIFREIVARFPNEMLEKKTTIERLILMQHYRFPTRLLDVTKNLLVSLFFACFDDNREKDCKEKGCEYKDCKSKDSKDKDGIVYFYSVPDDKIKYCDSDTVKIVSNLAKQPFNLRGGYNFHKYKIGQKGIKIFNKQVSVEKFRDDIQSESITLYSRVNPKDLQSVFCLRPYMNNERINRQSGYFFLFGIGGDGENKKECAKMEDEWILKPIIIPAGAKGNILKELDKMDINEGFFYPDYEHVAKSIGKRFGKN